MAEVEKKYVAFCDILGFSNSVLIEFDKTLSIYKDFKKEISLKGIIEIDVSLYSDSILIIGDDIFKISEALQLLLWTALRYDFLIRGGIAYGRHWRESDENNLFIVSEALVKAVNIEKTIKHPIIVISKDIDIPIKYWFHACETNIFELPILHYKDLNIINPFNKYWFKSVEIKLQSYKSKSPKFAPKYDYLLTLVDAIKKEEEFIPKALLAYLVDKKILGKKP